MLAVLLGLYFSSKFFRLGAGHVTGAWTYSFTYLLYAIMISSGLVLHCLFLVECGAQPETQVRVTGPELVLMNKFFLEFGV